MEREADMEMHEESLKRVIGFPINSTYSYEPVIPYLKYTINNIGDPYVPTTVLFNTHDDEKDLLNFFIDLW